MATSSPILPANGGDANDVVEVAPVLILKKKKKLTSAVWNDFTREKKDNIMVAICKHCNKPLSGVSTSGTSHLKNHLKRCLRKSTGDVSQQLLRYGEKKKEGTVDLENFRFDNETSRLDLARMIIFHEYPFIMVEHVAFRKFVKNLQPSFSFMTAKTAKVDCMKVYESEKLKVYETLNANQGRISFTSDLWTSNQNLGYMSLTAHYVDCDWKLQKKILNFLMVDVPHNAERLADSIMTCLMDWNLDGNVFSMTLDNCSTNDSMATKITDTLNEKQLLLFGGDYFHIRCAAHILNLIVKDGLTAIEGVIDNIHESVKYVTKSPKKEKMFKDVVQQVNIISKKELFLDCPTRWNSTFSMLQVAIEYKDAFSRLQARDRDYKFAPSVEDWDRASVVSSCLKPFYDTTKIFSGVKYPMANLLFFEVCEIKVELMEWCNSTNCHVNSMAKSMQLKFDKYWSTCHVLLAVAAVLDPRYKMKVVECYYPQIYGSAVGRVESKSIYDSFVTIYDEYATHSLLESSWEARSRNSDGNLDGGSSKKMKRFDTYISETSVGQEGKSDLDYYLEEPILPRTPSSDFDALTWWKMHEAKYPVLAKMARDILAIPVSTVASESAFSTGGRVVSKYRSSLNPDTVQALVCTQDWMKADFGDHATSTEESTSSCNEPKH